MKARVSIRAVLAIGLMLTAGSARPAEIECNREFVTRSSELLKLAGYGYSPYERAAFVVLDSSGRARFVLWPLQHRFCEATYDGVTPVNAVAIIHTHPNVSPLPSNDDARLARRIHLPVYVLTRTMITRTNGREMEILRTGDWLLSPERATFGRCTDDARVE